METGGYNMDHKDKKRVSLKNLSSQIPTERVYINETDYLEVKGLSTDDISFLYSNHNEIIAYVLEGYNPAEFTSRELASNLTRNLPSLVYLIVAMSIDETDYAGVVGQLPINTVIDLMEKVIALTIPDDLNKIKKIIAMMNLT